MLLVGCLIGFTAACVFGYHAIKVLLKKALDLVLRHL